MILVLAGNQRQYIQWMKERNLTRSEARYVARPEHYLGLKDCDFVMVGEYHKNKVFRDPAFEAYAATHGFRHLADMSNAPVVSGT